MCRDRKAHILTGRLSLAPALRLGGRGVPVPQPGPSYQEGQALGGVPDSSFHQQGRTSVGPCHCRFPAQKTVFAEVSQLRVLELFLESMFLESML